MFCNRSLIPCRWGRATIQKAALFVTCTLLFTCLALMDMQMRCNSACRTVEGDTLMLLARALVSPPRTLQQQLQSSSNLSKGSRKLSFHAEELFLNDTERDIFDDEEDSLDSKTSFVDFTLNLTEADGTTSSVHSTMAYLSRPKVRNSTVGRRLPHALIIGVKKGGTRALLEILRLHPDVRAPGPEPHFFDRHYHKGIDWYRRQMPLSLDNQLTMEKTPSYFITPEVPGLVFNMSRDIRLLVVVRDPVTRAVSDYTQASSKRRDTKTFEDMAFLNSSTGLVDTNWSAIKIGVYARHLDRWLKYFPLDHFHFVSGEKLISDPVSELEAVQDFLGLRRVICANHFFFNQTKGFPCLRRSLNSNVPHCLGKTKGRSHPYIPPSALQRLRDFYRPFNQKFYKVVGRNFNWF